MLVGVRGEGGRMLVGEGGRVLVGVRGEGGRMLVGVRVGGC